MVIAAEPVHSGDGLVLNTVLHAPHIGAHESPFDAASHTRGRPSDSAPSTAERVPSYKSTTELLNPRRKFVHRDRPGIDVSDIAGTRSRKLTSVLGPRNVDPLDPVYALPSYELRPATPPKFVKDSLVTDDIWGAQPMIPRHQLIKTRDHIDYSDVVGSRSRPLVHSRAPRSQIDSLDVFDINRGEYHTFRTKRVTCPLSPRYDFDGARCSSLGADFERQRCARRRSSPLGSELVGHIEGSKPNPPPRARSRDLKLMTADIMGEHAMLPERRGGARNPNDVSDIAGAQANTVKFKPATRRQTNPLQPAYRFLDYRKHRAAAAGRSGSAPYSSQKDKGTFSFADAPSADLVPANPAFSGTAMKRGVNTFGKMRARRGGGLHMHHAKGSLKAPSLRAGKLPPMTGERPEKLTNRSAPPFDKARTPAFHRQNSKVIAGGKSQKTTAAGAGGGGSSNLSQYQQKRRAEQRAADAESVRALGAS